MIFVDHILNQVESNYGDIPEPQRGALIGTLIGTRALLTGYSLEHLEANWEEQKRLKEEGK